MTEINSRYSPYPDTFRLTRGDVRHHRRRTITMTKLQEAIGKIDSHPLPSRDPRHKATIESLLAAPVTTSPIRRPTDIEVSTHCMWAVGGSIVATVVVDKFTGTIVDWSSQFVAHGPTTSVASAV